jgi:2-amino-4-hydroxy-6-hydroxymethyldihydropteridine diphosphokinase
MKRKSIRYYLSLGSNKGDKRANINKALDSLQEIGSIITISSLYETAPLGMAAGAENFYNLVLSLQTCLTPRALLSALKDIEQRMGRDIHRSHNLPRIIDIDILLADHQVIETRELVIPHKEMTKRAFVLIPLNEIAPEVEHPVHKKTVSEILRQLPAPYRVSKLNLN